MTVEASAKNEGNKAACMVQAMSGCYRDAVAWALTLTKHASYILNRSECGISAILAPAG